VKVGSGLGDDAEELARQGFAVTAFDIAPTAVEWARRRFPASPVDYRVADVRDPPPEWRRHFDLVLEIYTLQALPARVRPAAAHGMAELLAPGGTLLLIARGREPTDHEGTLPWPLTPDEVRGLFASLELVRFEDFRERQPERHRRLRVEFRRPVA
jgi:SAM-dependent methyltransferase